MRAGVCSCSLQCSIEPCSSIQLGTIWSWAPPLLINYFRRYQERSRLERGEVQVSICIFIFRFSSRKSRIPFPFLDLYLSYRTAIARRSLIPPICCCCSIPCCIEHTSH